MSAANEELDKKIKRDGKDAVNIENLTSDGSPHVAMVLLFSMNINKIISLFNIGKSSLNIRTPPIV